ncbi:ATP-dependent DNA helicase RecQ [Pilibacter termitis]|uniref:DNA helicase RecQ n=1 Tax=Pilibacter termitis TaxID=263852 RepID=A0A1T4KIU3_9ENTE|nr:DNA helicase RecQ [Pilibacter termitis]SJZ42362.1 ATP-dependent DNA helicase RecQ [Pilibacter termitis]
MNLEKSLKENFGFSSFRKGQQEIITQVLERKNTLGILPTGAGKSICYQLPAVLENGLTLVVSPLIALMKDQVDGLQEQGISATFINSSLDYQEIEWRKEEILRGEVKLLFLAPERFSLGEFNEFLQQLPISLVAIDEAHCISSWGHDFRPSYLDFAKILLAWESVPTILALTATATKEVASDICRTLGIEEKNIIQTGFERKNLSFEVVKGKDKRSFVKEYLQLNKEESGIIYAGTRKEVDELEHFLSQSGFLATKYHAGLSEVERNRNQEAFINDECHVMVATNAFGMGINKSNVRFVLHYQVPGNIESYYQEAGRAGRDGLESTAILLYSLQDFRLRSFFIEQSEVSEDRKTLEYEKLRAMQSYGNTQGCLQRFILQYFGDDATDCGKCSNCLDDRESVDITIDTQKVLSNIKRMGERFGKTLVAKVLIGSKDQNVLKFRFEQLQTYGILKNLTQKQAVELIDFLVSEGYIAIQKGQMPILLVSELGVRVLKGEEKVFRKMTVVKKTVVTQDEELAGLFEVLRSKRLELAREQGVAPFLIFSDASLHDMANLLPETDEQFLEVKGVGQNKLEKYGTIFMEEIKKFSEKAKGITES